jgi:hypothetical protein
MKAEEIQKLVVVDVKDDRFTVTKKIGMCRELEHFATVYHLLNPPLGKTTERNLTKVELYTRLLKKDKILRAVSRGRAVHAQQSIHTLDKEVEKLDVLYEAAVAKKQLGAAVQAARLKAQLLGYLVEKKEVKHSVLDTMSDDELITYLDKLASAG